MKSNNVLIRLIRQARSMRYSEIIKAINFNNANKQNSIVLQYLQNEMLIRAGIVTETTQYKIAEKIHRAIRVEEIKSEDWKSKKRLGRDNDGGYVVCEKLSREKILYSFGISNDVSFEKDMSRLGYECFMYDHTINELPEDDVRFHWCKIGIAGKTETNNLKFLETLLRMNNHDKISGMFLKMDVEGAEWDFMEHTKMDIFKQFDQIAFEIHDLHNHNNTDKIVSCMRKLLETHAIIHIHANNNNKIWVTNDLVTPDALELTLVNRNLISTSENSEVYPNYFYDKPNVDGIDDICLGKWNVK